MIEVELGAAERDARKLKPVQLERAVSAIRDDGFVILHQAIESDHVAALREKMLADVAAILALDDVPYQFNDGHLQQDPPPFPPYLFRDVMLNDLVIEITRFILGEGVKNSHLTAATPAYPTRRNNLCTLMPASSGPTSRLPHPPTPSSSTSPS